MASPSTSSAPPTLAMEEVGNSPIPAVRVVSRTWARDSHDLFDFEAHHLHTKSFTVPRSKSFVRSNTDVQMLDGHIPSPPGTECLMRLVQKDGTFWVDKASPSSGSKKLWLVVRDLANGGHRLVDGDVIKLGRFKFRVRQMVTNEDSTVQPQLKLDESEPSCCVPDLGEDLSTTNCRICLLEGSTPDDPLISPCICKGSIEYVHLGCLRHWINGRLNLSDPGASSGSFFYRPLTCELCKASYPVYIHDGDNKQPLVEVPRTRPPFIVLENMVRDSQQHATRGLHVVSLADQAGAKLLKLGRGHESDVRIADVSISRCHATIRFHRGQFLLEDHHSKFGTLVAMKKPRALEAGHSISIQVGRTVISLSLQPQWHGDLSQTNGMSVQPTAAISSARDQRALRLSLLTRGNGGGSEPPEPNNGDMELPLP